MAKPFLFCAEPSKSGAATCKGCKQKIAKDELRVGVISYFPCPCPPFHESFPNKVGPFAVTTEGDIDRLYDDHHGWQWRWHHMNCFNFVKFPACTGLNCFVGNNGHGFTPISSLSAANKKTLEEKIKGGGGGVSSASAKAKAVAKSKAKAKAEPKAEAKARARAKAEARAEPSAPRAAGKARAAIKTAAKRGSEAAGSAPRAKAPRGAAAAIAGRTVCFTGTLELKRADASAAAAAAGARVASDVSKGTHIVVAGPGAGSKLAKASSLGVEVWDEAKFKAAVGL